MPPARAAAHITYPARFQLVAAMNPCRCGYLGDAARECGRAPRCGEDYQTKISGPLLDRIDLIIEITPGPNMTYLAGLSLSRQQRCSLARFPPRLDPQSAQTPAG